MGHQVHPFMHCIDKVEPQDSGLYHWRTSSTPKTEHDHLFYLTVEGERSCSRGIVCSFILLMQCPINPALIGSVVPLQIVDNRMAVILRRQTDK